MLLAGILVAGVHGVIDGEPVVAVWKRPFDITTQPFDGILPPVVLGPDGVNAFDFAPAAHIQRFDRNGIGRIELTEIFLGAVLANSGHQFVSDFLQCHVRCPSCAMKRPDFILSHIGHDHRTGWRCSQGSGIK